MSNELPELADTFRRLGAAHPEGWAQSQINEGIPQLHRFLFLRAAWSHVLVEGDTHWIRTEIDGAAANAGAPGSSIGPALDRLIAAGADRRDLSEVVRVMQWQLLQALCHQIDDSGIIETLPRDGEMPALAWGLFAVDEHGNPVQRIESLHESVLEIDPSGREMRPPAAL